MQGLHLTADASGCPTGAAALREPPALRTLCLAAVAEAGLTPVGELFHRFDGQVGGGGVTGVVLLAESHLAVHTWPESGLVTLDVFVCNVGVDNSDRAHALMDALIRGFEPASVHRQAVRRGTALAAST